MAKTIEKHIKQCVKGSVKAQKQLYNTYSPVLYGVCLRYSKSEVEAGEILQESFIKIFDNLKQFSFKGSFEGWMKRIVVHTALNYFKKNKKHIHNECIDDILSVDNYIEDVSANINAEDILKLVQQLPCGYRMVFNLYAIEGYSHQEIAKSLNITVNTSKSQLSRARKILQTELKKQNEIKYEAIA